MIETQNHFLAQSRENISKLQSEIKTLNIIDSVGMENIRSWIFAFFHVFYLVFGITILHRFSSENNFNTLLIYLVGGMIVLLLLGGIPRTNEYKKWKITRAIDNYQQRKIKIEHIYSSIVSDMNVDFCDTSITPKKIQDIEIGIHNLSSGITDMYRLYKGIIVTEKNVKVLNKKKIVNSYQNFLTQEGIWLTECIASFSHDLDTWMTRHYSELVQLQGSVDAQVRTTDIAEGKAALGLTEERISRLSEEIPIRVKS